MRLATKCLLGLVTDAIAPVPEQPTAEQILRNAQLEPQIGRLSPSILYEEATIALLNPEVRTIGFLLPQQVAGPCPGCSRLTRASSWRGHRRSDWSR